jgi:hypothetical protein
MMAFRFPAQVFTIDEHQGIIDLMMEREIRIRVSPDLPSL